MSRDLQNVCSRMKKKTRVEILKLESKEKNASRVEKKKKNLSRERENADQLCCPSMSSLHRDEASIQNSGILQILSRKLVTQGPISIIRITAKHWHRHQAVEGITTVDTNLTCF